MTVRPFLTFHGNCREALQFYQSVFGGEFSLTEIGQNWRSCQLPPEVRRLILQAHFRCEAFEFSASDLGQQSGSGNGRISLLILCSNTEIEQFSFALSEGKYQVKNQTTVSVIDRFGIEWILSAQ